MASVGIVVGGGINIARDVLNPPDAMIPGDVVLQLLTLGTVDGALENTRSPVRTNVLLTYGILMAFVLVASYLGGLTAGQTTLAAGGVLGGAMGSARDLVAPKHPMVPAPFILAAVSAVAAAREAHIAEREMD